MRTLLCLFAMFSVLVTACNTDFPETRPQEGLQEGTADVAVSAGPSSSSGGMGGMGGMNGSTTSSTGASSSGAGGMGGSGSGDAGADGG